MSGPAGSLTKVGYREFAPPTHAARAGRVARGWWTGRPRPCAVLPDGCMDLIADERRTSSSRARTPPPLGHAPATPDPFVGLRFGPASSLDCWACPRARCETAGCTLADLRSVAAAAPVTDRAGHPNWQATEPRGRDGAVVATAVEAGHREPGGGFVGCPRWPATLGWSPRTMQRHCTAVYGYGAATLRRVLRFRHARRLLDEGLPYTEVAARRGVRRPTAPAPRGPRPGRRPAGVVASGRRVARTDPPSCHPDRRPSDNADPTARRRASSSPGVPRLDEVLRRARRPRQAWRPRRPT